MPGGQSSSFLIPLGKSLSTLVVVDERSTGLACSFFTGLGVVVEELVEDAVDKVGERGVVRAAIEGVTDTELVFWGVAVEATADAAAAKAAAAMKAELCKKGEEKKEWIA